ncbi:MAG: type 4a pilus biogenesis protein PilO [Patescibacteria group bacterium]
MRNTIPIILIAASLGLFYFYISPEYSKMTAFQTEGANYDEILNKSVELKQIRAELSEKTSRFGEADLAKLDKMIPINMSLVRLVLEVDSLALKHAIVIHDIDASSDDIEGEKAETLKGYKTLTLAFRFDTDYSNLNGFLKEIEDSLRIMDIVKIELSPNKERPSFQSYGMTLNTYSLK